MQGQDMQRLNAAVDGIFEVFENVLDMFHKWDRSYHMPFIREVMQLQKLEVQLYSLGYDEGFVMTVVNAVYHNVFTLNERRDYIGNNVNIVGGFNENT